MAEANAAGYPKQDAAAAVPEEKTKEELAKMSKEERTAYHQARRVAGAGAGGGAKPAQTQLTKAQRREQQEAQRKVKEDKVNASKEGDELFEELKLQGLSEDQAKAVMAEMKAEQAALAEDDEDEEDECEDLLGSVRSWMNEQPDGPMPEDSIRDFNMKVRFQGHVDTTPPDHLECILTVLLTQAIKTSDLKADKVAPNLFSKALTPLLERWANLLRGLYSKIPDVLEAVGVIVKTVTSCLESQVEAEGAEDSSALDKGKDCAVVGCLMAVREVDDLVEDEDLLVGCKAVEPRSAVLEKFIEFLEDCVEEDDDEDSGDD